MCITLNAAELTNTKLYAGEAMLDGTYVHVVAYQNKAAAAGPNAMILPLPASRPVGAANAIDTRSFETFLDDIHEATRRLSMSPRPQSDLGVPKAAVFDVGSYTVVLAEESRAIAGALGAVPTAKRPALNVEVIDAFERLYPGWPLAVCCWNGTITAEPLLWWYEPKMPEWLFAPALDAHDGRAPDLARRVSVDHHVAFGAKLASEGAHVRYRARPGSERVAGLLPDQVRGTRVSGAMGNGDFWCSTKTQTGVALRIAPGREISHVAAELNGGDGRIALEGWIG